MSAREWKPGDVAMVRVPGLAERRVTWASSCAKENHPAGPHWHVADRETYFPSDAFGLTARALVVIDPEDRDQVASLMGLYYRDINGQPVDASAELVDQMQAALREFACPTPTEPTDPKARVTDRRDNIWRLLADGDWVCVSGPDVVEYIAWSRLVAERGPLTVEVPA